MYVACVTTSYPFNIPVFWSAKFDLCTDTGKHNDKKKKKIRTKTAAVEKAYTNNNINNIKIANRDTHTHKGHHIKIE